MKEYRPIIHMLDPIQYEFLFLFSTLADPELGARAVTETSIFRLQLRLRPKVPTPCGSSSTKLKDLTSNE
jgi:hypothetical protein